MGDFSLEGYLGLGLFGPLCLPLLDCAGEVRPAGLKQVVHGVHGFLDKFDRLGEVAIVPSGLSAAVKLGDGVSGGVIEGVCWWLVRGEDGGAVGGGTVGGGAGVSGAATGTLEEHGGADFASVGSLASGRGRADVDVDGRSLRGGSGRKNRAGGDDVVRDGPCQLPCIAGRCNVWRCLNVAGRGDGMTARRPFGGTGRRF
ncbi:hypothetical protein B0T18DRAFT_414993 [Schizothecium vesticola]|uniref:Uncharacterized protein n=1 Tax=Schizothecium vesticola TaxID=314040 RepID=A0AA40EPZ1_9PEZI|nr:hypothetical protein B0T18DRAFT_414993 [Schizothecium vesticola]